jgi:O-antigen ligase
MNRAEGRFQRLPPSGGVLLALVTVLPLMKPPVRYPVILADLVFLLVVAALAIEFQKGRRSLPKPLAVLTIYVLSLMPSELTSPDRALSAFKLLTAIYLVGLTATTMLLVDNMSILRRLTLTWLATTVVLGVLCLASLVAFAIDADGILYRYSAFHFGTLPPGNYPRLALTFFNANMACNYLTVSLGLLMLAWHQNWLRRAHALLLLAAILVAALSTISPGLGGIALLLGIWGWLAFGSRVALALGVLAALAFIAALAFTPIIHPTAPFLIEVPLTNIVLAPSGRFLTWSAAIAEFFRYPLLGHGIGIDAVDVRYMDPSGNLQELTDAHNLFLSIAAQTGIVGLAGLAALIAWATRLTFSSRAGGSASTRLILGLTFLDAFVYQGLGGSFEDTRHLWVLLGLLAAAGQLPVNPSGGNSRGAGAPSPC